MKKQGLHPRTERINLKQKTHSKLARLDALRWLAKTFPHAFDSQQEIQPLKIGILHDIMAHAELALAAGISKNKLREALVVFTRSIDYLACLKAREMRIDLEGNPTEQVTAQEAENAALKIKRRIEKSAKNARKQNAEKSSHVINHRKGLDAVTLNPTASTRATTPHHYPSYTAHMESGHLAQPKAHKPSIIVKPSRSFDPEAVARLKQKLGLSHKEAKAD
jgi:ProP effector